MWLPTKTRVTESRMSWLWSTCMPRILSRTWNEHSNSLSRLPRPWLRWRSRTLATWGNIGIAVLCKLVMLAAANTCCGSSCGGLTSSVSSTAWTGGLVLDSLIAIWWHAYADLQLCLSLWARINIIITIIRIITSWNSHIESVALLSPTPSCYLFFLFFSTLICRNAESALV